MPGPVSQTLTTNRSRSSLASRVICFSAASSIARSLLRIRFRKTCSRLWWSTCTRGIPSAMRQVRLPPISRTAASVTMRASSSTVPRSATTAALRDAMRTPDEAIFSRPLMIVPRAWKCSAASGPELEASPWWAVTAADARLRISWETAPISTREVAIMESRPAASLSRKFSEASQMTAASVEAQLDLLFPLGQMPRHHLALLIQLRYEQARQREPAESHQDARGRAGLRILRVEHLSKNTAHRGQNDHRKAADGAGYKQDRD